MSLHLLLTIGAGLLGGCIGSFLTVVTSRIPHGASIVQPGSACPRCGTEVAWFDNIPIVSWFVLRGKCRSCTLPIPIRYPALEALTCLVFVLCAWFLRPAFILPIASCLAGIIAVGEMFRTQRRFYPWVLSTAIICALIFALITVFVSKNLP